MTIKYFGRGNFLIIDEINSENNLSTLELTLAFVLALIFASSTLVIPNIVISLVSYLLKLGVIK